MNKRYINLQFKKLLEDHDSPDEDIHALRHTHATIFC